MNRRNFLSASSSLIVPLMLNGFGIKALGNNSALLQSLRTTAALNSDRVLVVIYLGGGNDGLNTIIPIDQYSKYKEIRPNIAIPEDRLLKLSLLPEVGLHPSMGGLQRLFEEGKLAIINSVSYPNPDQSHYRSTDIWMTGVDSNQYSSSGWLGRYLGNRYVGYPANYPNEEMEDPLALQIGQISTTALLANTQSAGITIQDPNTFYQLVGESNQGTFSDLPCCSAGELISYIRQKQVLAVGYASEIKQAADAGRNLGEYPEAFLKNELAEQLKIVARLIHGGLKSKIFYVELGGFDTHAGQVGSSPLEGVHTQLLRKLSDAIYAFQNDLKLQGIEDKVIGMTFSDFGRRANSNASKGTDHGVGAPMFVFGTGIKRQVIGMNPDLINGVLSSPSGSVNNIDIKMQVDFRRVYTDILNDWFGTATFTTGEVLFKNFPTTSLFSETVRTISSGAWVNPEIWSTGRVPSAKDVVNIRSGHVVEVAQFASAKDVKVDSGGELKFLGDYSINLIK